MQLRRSVLPNRGGAILDAVGELDVADVAHLRKAIVDAFTQGHHCVLVDLSKVSFIDSTAVTVLLEEHRAAAARGEHLGLVAPGEQVRRVLALLGLDRVLRVYDSLDDAVAAR